MSIHLQAFEKELWKLAQDEMDEWAQSKQEESFALQEKHDCDDKEHGGLHRDNETLGRERKEEYRRLWKAHVDEKQVFKAKLKGRVRELCELWGPKVESASTRARHLRSIANVD